MTNPAKRPFTRFAAILRSVQCLGLVLILAQAGDPNTTSNSDTNSNDSSSGSGSDQPPPVDTITKVPATISDAACDSGQRNVVKIYKNGALMKTERKDCVG